MGRNSIKCTKCANWVHKRCHGLLDKNVDDGITLDEYDIETVETFSFL